MKLNWGHGLTVFIVAFMALILSFVYRSFQRDIDLISPDYYQKEIAFQSQINAKKAMQELGKSTASIQGDYYLIELPQDVQVEEITVNGVCLSDKTKDFTTQLTVDQNKAYLPKSLIVNAQQEIEIRFQQNEVAYYDNIQLP